MSPYDTDLQNRRMGIVVNPLNYLPSRNYVFEFLYFVASVATAAFCDVVMSAQNKRRDLILKQRLQGLSESLGFEEDFGACGIKSEVMYLGEVLAEGICSCCDVIKKRRWGKICVA